MNNHHLMYQEKKRQDEMSESLVIYEKKVILIQKGLNARPLAAVKLYSRKIR